MSLNITNLSYLEENIGLNIHMSKRQFIWKFDLNGIPQEIKLLDSRLSNKKRLYKNDNMILNTKSKKNFSHEFEIDGHTCLIIQYADKFELRIDNQSFTHIYNWQKNKQMFEEKNPVVISKKCINKICDGDGPNREEENKKNEEVFYKPIKTEENKPSMYNFTIQKDKTKKLNGFKKIFQFGAKKGKTMELNLPEYNHTYNNINDIKDKNNINLLDFSETNKNEETINNQTQNQFNNNYFTISN